MFSTLSERENAILAFNLIMSKILLFSKGISHPFAYLNSYQPFPKRQILDSSNLKEFADDNFKFYENGRKFTKRTENTVGKGEIARNEQFLLFPKCFQKTCTAAT